MTGGLRFVIAAALAVSVSACAAGGRVTVLADRAWWRVAGDPVRASLRETGYRVRVVIVEPGSPIPELRAGGKIVVGPLIAGGLAAAADPTALVVAVGRMERPYSAVTLLPGDPAAYEQAGRIAAEAAGHGAVGILSADTESADRFARGAAQGGARVVRRRLRGGADRTEARRQVEAMGGEGALVFLLQAYELTPGCLEAVASLQGKAVVEDMPGALRPPVILSLDTDWVRGLQSAFQAQPGDVVAAPVVLRAP